ncbi:hypothetical protein BGW38_002892 [Lunasporangiospora selenospora]|uniref:TAFII55 protein conserved region domain-containing protein n=1 Tax=Lunasporangiospora selenospora TaxID=979761 RepID=A0A9P6KHV9_9FUNG|nr:hypothetical protein BGW38_002892 [Lunasporangiospora selenospora]
MSNPSDSGAGFPAGVYPQPIGTFSGSTGGRSTAGPSNSGRNASAAASSSSSSLGSGPGTSHSLPLHIPVAAPGTAPRKQLAAAAAAGAAAGSSARSGRSKNTPRKTGAGGTSGGAGGGAGSGQGRRAGNRGGAGGRSNRAGAGGRGASTAASAGNHGDDDDLGGGRGSKDSDDDNEDEPEVSIEEQFILRLPPGEMCDRFREKVTAREIDESVIMQFLDARRGTFTFEGKRFPTKLVDLPTIVEAQKTLNAKQFYKIADISQMLIVDETPMDDVEVKTEKQDGTASTSQLLQPPQLQPSQSSASSTLPPLKMSDYSWPDGLTNPLRNVRKRRFRKRVSKVAVEGVENEIERLLKEDSLAEEVHYEIREHIEGIDLADSEDGATPAPGGPSDMEMDDNEGEEDEDEDEEDDLAFMAEIERHIDAGENSSEDDDDADDSGTPAPGASPSIMPTTAQGVPPSSSGPLGAPKSLSGAGIGSSSMAGSSGIKNNAGSTTIPSARFSASTDTGKSAARLSAGGDNSASGVSQAGGSRKSEKTEEDEEEDEDEEDEEDEDDESGSEDEDEDEDEDDKESAQMEKLLKDEIKELNAKVKDNEDKLRSAPNDILRRRFGSILENLRKELELKTMQLEEVKDSSKSKGK